MVPTQINILFSGCGVGGGGGVSGTISATRGPNLMLCFKKSVHLGGQKGPKRGSASNYLYFVLRKYGSFGAACFQSVFLAERRGVLKHDMKNSCEFLSKCAFLVPISYNKQLTGAPKGLA